MALPAGARLGPYKVLSALGSGGMGEVYKAEDTRLGRVVAIKVLRAEYAADPGRRARFEREARAVAALSHPHICTLFDIGRDAGTDFLVMEYLEGETLSARLARAAGEPSTAARAGESRERGHSGLSLPEVLRVATDIADALVAAHKAGVVHRDLKPGNIMLTKALGDRSGSLQAKVLDFGLARRLVEPQSRVESETREADPLTRNEGLVGTMPYMSPEQLEGRAIDARSDLFAFGAVLYEMVTGRRAFEASSQARLIALILDHDPEPLAVAQPLMSRGLERLVRKCLAKDPDARWQSAADVADELRWLRGSSEAQARRATAPARLVGLEDRPNFGRLVASLCDRQIQEDEFRDCFLESLESAQGAPQMYFVPGEEGQCHEAMVRRLVDRIDRSMSAGAYERSAGRVKKIAWQHDGVLAQRYARQVFALFEHFGPTGLRPFPAKDRSATAFGALLGSLHAYVVIEHEVHASRWDDTTAELLEQYVKFLAEVPRAAERAVLVLFISVIFPRTTRSPWKKLLPMLDLSAVRRRRIQRALLAVEQTAGIPCRVLTELTAVTREDLLEWFSLNRIYESEDKRIQAVDRLFPLGAQAPRAMREIEAFCAEELRNFTTERGYAEAR